MSVDQNFMLLAYENPSENGNTSGSISFDKEDQLASCSFHKEPSNVLGSITCIPSVLHKNFDHYSKTINKKPKKTSLLRNWWEELMANETYRTMKKKAVTRKMSARSRQHLIPLSDELRYERGEIITGECSTSNPASIRSSTGTNLTSDSIRNIVREEIRHHLSTLKGADCWGKRPVTSILCKAANGNDIETPSENLDHSSDLNFKMTSEPSTEEQDLYKESEEKCEEAGLYVTHSGNLSEGADSDTPEITVSSAFLSDENRFISSQKSFRTILQLQIEIWRKLLQLKESTEILEKIALSRQLECKENNFQCLENEMNAIVVNDHSLPNPVVNSSMKAVFSQLDSDEGSDSFASNDLVHATLSCYSKMNEIEHRLSDVEFHMASIHQILQVIRKQQYLEIKSHRSNMAKNQRKRKQQLSEQGLNTETVGDGYLVNEMPTEMENELKELQTKPPATTKSDTNIPVRNLNHYDESYYEWRQYHMNLMHYKKSERTLALNKRPMVNIMKPPIRKYLQHNEMKYLRVKKPFFIITPSRTNSLWNYSK